MQAALVMRDYLAEVVRLVEGSDLFSVLAHIDYPVSSWPADAEPYDPNGFEAEFRFALGALAESGRALEVNTRVAFHPDVDVVRDAETLEEALGRRGGDLPAAAGLEARSGLCDQIATCSRPKPTRPTLPVPSHCIS